jgi:hypothetical protein
VLLVGLAGNVSAKMPAVAMNGIGHGLRM